MADAPTIPEKMKALFFRRKGGPEVLEVGYLPVPELESGDLLVKVRAASINPADYKQRSEGMGLFSGLPYPWQVGFDFAGVVVKVGDKAKDEFQIGDEVFGDCLGIRKGSVAEYMVVDACIAAKKPSNLSFEEAASVPLAGLTALQMMQHTNLKEGHRVFITGGAGGVGSLGIQIAKNYFKASHVATTASPAKKAFVQGLGADEVINYREEDVVKVFENGPKFDSVIDCTSEADRLHAIVGDGGSMCGILKPQTTDSILKWQSIAGSRAYLSGLTKGAFSSFSCIIDWVFGGKSVVRACQAKGGMYYHMITSPTKTDIELLANLLESETIKPCIDTVYTFDNCKEAVAHVESGTAKGKIVITIWDGK